MRGYFLRKMPKKIKGLMPSLREKKRYLKFRINILDQEKVFVQRPLNEVIKNIKQILGLFGSAKAGIVPVSYDSKAKTGILRVATSSLDEVKASFLFIKELGTQKVILNSLKVSGSINNATEE